MKSPYDMERDELIREVSELRHRNNKYFERLQIFEVKLQKVRDAHEWASNQLSEPDVTWKKLAMGFMSRTIYAVQG